jgi:pimeloyl-ACP methyl ester carboxylesterase
VTDTAAPVVLLHGSAFSGAQWRALADQLTPRYHVLAPDLCGYGTSAGWSGRGAFRLAHETAGVLADILPLGAPVHLVGHSYGGAVALHIARQRPELVRSLTLIEPVAVHLLRAGDQTDLAALGQMREVAAELGRALGCGDFEGGCARFVDYWNGAGAWAAMPPARRDALIPRLGKVVIDFHAIFSEEGGLQDLYGVPPGTLLIQGTLSPLPVRRICRLLAGALRDARVSVVAGAGHMLPLTHPGPVNQLIEEHIQATQTNQPRENTNEEDHLHFDGIAGRGLREFAGA